MITTNINAKVLGLFERTGGVLFRDATSFLEIAMGITYLGWGWIMTVSHPLIFEVSPAYKPMSEVAPAFMWGLALYLASALLLGGNLFNIRLLRGTGAVVGFVLWAFIAAMFWVTANVPTGVVVYGTFAAACLLITIRHVYKAVSGRRAGV